MTLIAVDPNVLSNLAQWLEARSDPLAAASELRLLVSSAPVAVHPSVAEALHRALRNYGSHTCAVHRETKCGLCLALETWELAQ